MNLSKRSWLSLLIVLGLLLTSIAPALAQDDAPPLPDGGLPQGSSHLFLPSIGRDYTAPEPGADGSAPDVQVPPEAVTQLERGSITRQLPADFNALQPNEPLTQDGGDAPKLDPALDNAQGRVQVIVQLSEPAAAAAAGMSAAGDTPDSAADNTPAISAAAVNAAGEQQALVLADLQRLDPAARQLGSMQKVLNAVIVETDAAIAAQLAQSDAVLSVHLVVDYLLDDSATTAYIGGATAHQAGYTGAGVRIGVIDSGIDYTHKNLGGPGTADAYLAAYGADPADLRNTTRDDLFPTARVVEGYDFVGETWRSGLPLAPDPDPIDREGHGTHVADIIAGAEGVAPGASLYALKVCSALSSECSGVALLQALEYAVDPNKDNNAADHLDIVNLSLGRDYGQAFDNDVSKAVENAANAGVLTVAAAGNGGDRPFIVSTPAASPSALAVAQTEMPTAGLPLLKVVAAATVIGDMGMIHQSWSAAYAAAIEAPLQYGNGAGANLTGCDPFAAGSLTGKVLLVDRGVCNVSIKVSNAAAAGAPAVIVGLVAPGDPCVFPFGGGAPTAPAFNITQADAAKLKTALSAGPVTVRLDPAAQQPLVKHVAATSSRGPTMLTAIIKPEIAAPGASVSAVAGGGDAVAPFSGTSGAAPMVTGAAALVKQKYPDLPPAQIKALLVNTADPNIMNKPALFGGKLAPITRIGGGEVHVDRALATNVAAWNGDTFQPTLSLGFKDLSQTTNFPYRVIVRNYSQDLTPKVYQVSVTFRSPDDEATGAIQAFYNPRLSVPGRNVSAPFSITFRVNPDKLRNWGRIGPNSGDQGANGDLLSTYEYDGYVTFTNFSDANDVIRIPWHILPRKAGEVSLTTKTGGAIQLYNGGLGSTRVESYSLIGVSGVITPGGAGQNNPTPDLRFVGYATYPVPAGQCSAQPSFIMAFAVNTYQRQTHANAPFEFAVDLDTNLDAKTDYRIFSGDQGWWQQQSYDGRNRTWVLNKANGNLSAITYTDHQLNSANTVMYICAEQIGMTTADFYHPIKASFFAVDNYFANPYSDFDHAVRDSITNVTISPLGEQYIGLFDSGGVGSTTLAPRGGDKLQIVDVGRTTNDSEKGLLLLYRDGAPPDKAPEAVALTP